MRTLLVSLSILSLTISANAGPTSLLGGAITFQLPSSWRVQRQGPHGSAEIVQVLIPDAATDNTPESSNAVITAEPLQSGFTIKSFGDSSVRKPDLTVLTDIPAGKTWRTVLSHGHPGKTPYVVLDRFGVDAGYMVQLRVAFPVIQRADARWMADVAGDCNKLIKSLKIRGKNVVTSEVKIDHGVLWLRDLKDPAKNFDYSQ
jgi:hypothetical protein